jgi:cytoskeleton protein RodZ
MTASDATTRVVSDSGNDVGPGQRLREAREAANLTLAEVATRMRLEPRVLDLLEHDDFERLHGATFVRGYLSGYARLLDLPERPILESYERHGHAPPALVSELGHKPEVHVSDFPVRMVTYVIAGLLVVLVVLWWQSRQPPIGVAEFEQPGADGTLATDQPPSSGETADVTVTSSDGPPTTDSAAVAGTTEETTEAARRASESAGEIDEPPAQPVAANEQTSGDDPAYVEVPPRDNTQISAAPAQTPMESQDPGPGNGDQTSGDEATSTTPDETDSLAATSDSADTGSSADVEEQPPRPAPLPGSDRLAIQLARDSWVEIYDRGGARLYYSLAQEGSEVVVQGAGPMRVLLGDVEGAVVAYNGEPYDLSRYQGRSLVRFTIGELSGTTAPESPAPTESQEPLTLESPPSEFEQRVVQAGPELASPGAGTGSRRQEVSATASKASGAANNPLQPDS